MTPPPTRVRRPPHPAAVALAVLCAASLVGLVWLVVVVVEVQNNAELIEWPGSTPPPAVVEMWMFANFAYSLVFPALATAVSTAAIGLVLVWCLRRMPQRATRTRSEAGATVNVAPVTRPNSSPSISNSSGSPSMPISTARPRR